MRIQKIIVALLLAATAACVNPTAGLQPFPRVAENANGYELGGGDKIRVVVIGFEDLSNEYNVSDTGTISMPMIGTIAANGKTTEQLEAQIAGTLETLQLAVDPTVSVQIEAYRPFYILGEVRTPGPYPYVPGMSVLTAVAIAGGHTFRANTEIYKISRTTGGEVMTGTGDANTQVMPGDTVVVYEAWF